MTSQQHEIESSSVWLLFIFNETHELRILFIHLKQTHAAKCKLKKITTFPFMAYKIENMWRSAIAVAKWACKDDTIIFI